MQPEREKQRFAEEMIDRLFINYRHTQRGFGSGTIPNFLEKGVKSSEQDPSILFVNGPPGAGKTTLAVKMFEVLRWRSSSIDAQYKYLARIMGDWLEPGADVPPSLIRFKKNEGLEKEYVEKNRFISLEGIQRIAYPQLRPDKQAWLEAKRAREGGITSTPAEAYEEYNQIGIRSVALARALGHPTTVELPGLKGRGDRVMEHFARENPEETSAVFVMGSNPVEQLAYQVRSAIKAGGATSPEDVQAIIEELGFTISEHEDTPYLVGIGPDEMVNWLQMMQDDILTPLHNNLHGLWSTGVAQPDKPLDAMTSTALGRLSEDERARLREQVLATPQITAPLLAHMPTAAGEERAIINPENTRQRNDVVAGIFTHVFYPSLGFSADQVATVMNFPTKPEIYHNVFNKFDFIQELDEKGLIKALEPTIPLHESLKILGV